MSEKVLGKLAQKVRNVMLSEVFELRNLTSHLCYLFYLASNVITEINWYISDILVFQAEIRQLTYIRKSTHTKTSCLYRKRRGG